MEVGTRAIIGSPVVAIGSLSDEPGHQMSGAQVGGSKIVLLVGRPVKLRGGQQRAVIVKYVLDSVVQHLAVVGIEKPESLFGRAQIRGAGKVPVGRHSAGDGQGRDRHASTGAETDLIEKRAGRVLHAPVSVGSLFLDLRAPV